MLLLLRDMIRQNEGSVVDKPAQPDTSETIYISPLSLVKMMRHARNGIPLEVMGLLLGEFVDDYTVNVVDVFPLPQVATAVDPVYQAKMLDMLKQTGRFETVVGWYHSHPGFGCWLSNTDVNTQVGFEQLSPRAVAIVIDPVQSVKGKIVIDAFRTISLPTLLLGQEARQVTSNIGHLQKPSVQSLIRGLNRHYYSIPVANRMRDPEQKMLLNLKKQDWTNSLAFTKYKQQCAQNETTARDMLKLTELYTKTLNGEKQTIKEGHGIKDVGKQDPKRHLEETVSTMLADNIMQSLAGMLNVASFH